MDPEYAEGSSARSNGNQSEDGNENGGLSMDQLLENVKTMKVPIMNVNLNHTRYKVVRRCCRELGWKLLHGKKNPHSMSWLDCGGSSAESHITNLNAIQKLNHFPGMSKICQKCKLALTYNRLNKEFPELFDFHPRTFSLPKEKENLKRWFQQECLAGRKKPIIIVKPDGGCQGQGIFLTNDTQDLEDIDDTTPVAVQQYLDNPYLIKGYKFDLRIYVVVTSCTPRLRAFQHEEGIVRFCTEKYCKPKKENLHERYMHLTNYAINKNNENACVPADDYGGQSQSSGSSDCSSDESESDAEEESDEEEEDQKDSSKGNTRSKYTTEDFPKYSSCVAGNKREPVLVDSDFAMGGNGGSIDSKWSLRKLYKYFRQLGKDVEKLKLDIQDVVTKTLLSIQPSLAQEYKACFPTEGTSASSSHGFRCFELLGFDILLDETLKPWVIEVNHSPSLHIDADLDTRIKTQVVHESLVLGCVDADDLLAGEPYSRARTIQAQKEKLGEIISKRYKGNMQKNQQHCTDVQDINEKIEKLREMYEDGHSGGFFRILPPLESNPFAADYARIEAHKPALYKESPVTQRRREAIEQQRKKMEAVRDRHRSLVGDRPAWGSRRQLSQSDEALEKLKRSLLKEKNSEPETTRNSAPPLPRVATLKPYEKAYRIARRKDGHSPRSGESPRVPVRPALPVRQACTVRVQTLSFAGLCISNGSGNKREER